MKNIIYFVLIFFTINSFANDYTFNIKYSLIIANEDYAFYDNISRKEMFVLDIEPNSYALFSMEQLRKVNELVELSKIECINKTVEKTVYKEKITEIDKYSVLDKILIVTGILTTGFILGYTYNELR